MAKEPVPIVALGREPTLASPLLDQLEREGEVMVLGRASEPLSAVRMCRDRGPQCVLLFAETTAQVQLMTAVLGKVSIPVVALTRTARLGVESMAAGATETLTAESTPVQVATALRLMAQLQLVSQRSTPFLATQPRPPVARPATAARTGTGELRPLVLVGTSTGGPPALVELLTVLGGDFPAPVLVVQHMPDDYDATFASWLGDQLPQPVGVAAPGTFPQPSRVYVVPSGGNTQLGQGAVFLSRPRSARGPCPSVDVLFESAARLQGFALCGVVMTGMGSDGAQGLLAIRKAGGFTVVQDRASCVVYGMPAEALKLGAADFALSPTSLGEQLWVWSKAITPSLTTERNRSRK